MGKYYAVLKEKAAPNLVDAPCLRQQNNCCSETYIHFLSRHSQAADAETNNAYAAFSFYSLCSNLSNLFMRNSFARTISHASFVASNKAKSSSSRKIFNCCLMINLLMITTAKNVLGQLSFTNSSHAVTIDWSSNMPASIGTSPGSAYTGAGFEPNPTAPGRLNSNAWAVTGWSDGDLAFGGTQISGDYARGTATGAITQGGFYAYTAFPAAAATPLFYIQPGGSDFAPGTLTLKMVNNGTSNITQLSVSYIIDYRNDQGRSNSLNFSYSTDNSSYTAVPSMDFATPEVADGSFGVVIPAKSTTITGLSIPPGANFYIRWISNDVSGSGSRDEIGLGGIILDATFATPSVTSFIPTSGYTGSTITITGTNFTGATSVKLGGVEAASFTIDNATQITAVVGEGATGLVSVTTPNGTASSSASFTYNGYKTIAIGDWSDGSIWLGGNVPPASANKDIGFVVTISSPTSNSGIIKILGNLKIASTLTNSGTVTFFPGGGLIIMEEGGSVLNTGTVNYAGSGALIYNGTTARVSGDEFPATNGPVGVNLNITGGFTLQAPRTVSNYFHLDNGLFDNSINNITLGDGASIARSNGSISVAPLFSGVADFEYLNGPSVLTTGPELPAASSVIRNLYINAQVVQLNSSINVNQDLNIYEPGKLILGNNNVTATTVNQNYGPTAYLVTNGTGTLTIKNINSTPVLFPLGYSTSSYTPVIISNGGGNDFTARVQSTFTNAPADAGKTVNAEWTIGKSGSPTGNNVTFTTKWKATDEAGSFVRTNPLVLGHYGGSSWDEITAGAVSGPDVNGLYSTTINGVSSLSPFAVGNAGAFAPLCAPIAHITGGGDYCTIQEAINAATNGDIISIDAGTYAEEVVVNKEVEIYGAGSASTIIVPATSNSNTGGGSLGGTNVFLIQANNVKIHDLGIDGNNTLISSSQTAGGVDIDARNGIITDHSTGVYTNLEVYNTEVKNVWLRGIYQSSGGTFNFHHNTVSNVQGEYASIALFAYGSSGTFDHNTVSYANDAISANHSTGTVFSNNTVTNSGSGIHTDNGGDGGGTPDEIVGNSISNSTAGGYGIFVFAPYKNVTVHDNTVTNVDVGMASAGAYAAVTPVFSNNLIDGQNKAGSTGMYATTQIWGYGDGNNNTSFINNYVINNADGFFLETNTGYTLNFGAHYNSITGNSNTNVTETGTGTLNSDMTCNWWGSTISSSIASSITGTATTYIPFLPDGTDSDLGATGFQSTESCSACALVLATSSTDPSCPALNNGEVSVNVTGGSGSYTYSWNTVPVQTTATATGLVAGTYTVTVTDVNGCMNTANVTISDNLTGATVHIGSNNYCTIQSAINAASPGDEITVDAGAYNEDVLVNKSVKLTGAGAGTTTISGPIGGGGATVSIAANNVEVSGFTITRDGNNTTDWNNSNLNFGGVTVQGLAITGLNLHDNIITGNRTGIDINNSNGHNIHNNIIENNHTGLIFRNQTDNISFTENEVINNRTVGVLFLDASSGTNSPVQTAVNCNFNNNNISGNWYGQIVDRQAGGSLPTPGTTNLKNFSGNWIGTNTPVVTTANSAEPGYASLIPVVFGGSATAPGGQPDIAGPASANFDYTPYLNESTDVNIETTPGRGTFGFQGSFEHLWVTAASAQTGATTRIQEGVNSVTGSTVEVTAGTYNENVVINSPVLLRGAGNTTVLTPSSACSGNGITINANNTTVKSLKVTNYTYGFVVAASTVVIDSVESVSNCTAGIEMGNGISGLTVKNSKISNNTQVGFRAGTGAQMSNITIDSCEVKDNVQGMYIAASSALLPNSFDNISIKNSDFSNNTQKGMYFEKLSNAVIENIVMDNSGTDASYGFNNGIDINLKYGSYSNITIKNSSITNCGANGISASPDNASAITIKGRDDAPSYNTVPATLSNVTVMNNFIHGPQNGIRFGEVGKTNATPTNVTLTENDLGYAFANKAIINLTTNSINNATCNWYGTTDGDIIYSKIAGPVTYKSYLTDGTDNSGNAGFQPVPGTCSGPTRLYVNDISIADDVYTTAIGNDANPGTPGAPYATLAYAISQAKEGDTIYVDAGTYNIASAVNIDKGVVIVGAHFGDPGTASARGGESILSDVRSAATNPGAFTISTTSVIEIDGFTFAGSKIITGQPANATLRFRNTRWMLMAMPNSGQTNMIYSTGCRLTLSDNYFKTTGFNPSNSAVMQVAGGYNGTGTNDSVNIINNTFKGVAVASPYNNGNGQSTLQLNFSSCQGTVSGNTFDGVDIGLIIAGNSGNMAVQNNLFDNILRDATNDIPSGYYGTGILIFDPAYSGPVTISGNTFQNSDCGIRSSNAGGTETGSNIILSTNTFTNNLYHVVHRYPTGVLTFNNDNVFDGVTLASATLPQLFSIEDKIVHKVDVSGYGLVLVKSNNLYVTTNSFFTPGGTTTALVQRAIDASSNGFTVNVADGTYNEDVTINKTITVDGQSHAAVLRGLYSGANPNSVFIAASNAVLKDVTVTRDFGADLAAWYACTKNQGISVAQTTTGIIIDNVVVKDNRNGIFVNNAQNVTITNCTIENNRTGLHFGNNISGAEIHNNFIRNNYTHGLLFNYDLAVTITATNAHITNNDISGNWYSQVNFQNNTNNTYGDHTGLDFSCNWYGSASPAAIPANAAEPGYGSQPPVQFGGTDPGLNRQLYGTAIALCPYSPWLTNGSDNDLVADGFQPVPGACGGMTLTDYYVNDNSSTGDHYTTALGSDANAGTSSAPLATIQHAIDVAGPGATIWVDAGDYYGDLVINKSVTIKGSNAGNDPLCDGAGHTQTASVVYPTSDINDPYNASYTKIIKITTDNVVIDGLTINGDNPSQTGQYNAAVGIAANSGQSGIDIKNNSIQNLPYVGIDLSNDAGAVSGNNQIRNNRLFDMSPSSGFGIAVYTGNNTYADIMDNCMSNVRKGIQGGENNYLAAPGSISPVWSGNTIESYKIGIWNNLAYGTATPVTISNNNITTVSGSTENSGIEISSIQGNASVSVTNNTVTGAMAGINLWNNPTTVPLTIGANTFTNCTNGVFANNYDGYNSNANSSSYVLDGLNISGGVNGIYVKDNSLNTNSATVAVQITNNTSVTGSTTALKIEGGGASASFSGATPASFSGNTVYIDQVTNTIDVPATAIDATNVSFDGSTGSSMSLTQLFSTEDKINHKVDWSSLGFVTVNANNSYVTTSSFIAPNTSAAEIQRGIDVAANGWTVNVANGTYDENEVNINKSLTVQGESLAAIMKGLYSGAANTVIISASNATLKDVTVTRDYGANVNEWYNSARNQGINVGQTTTGVKIQHVYVKDNRNGIYLNNAQNVTIENCTIEDNRTGIQLANNVSGTIIRNNFIRNNFTHGIVLNFDTPPGITANNLQINNNDLSGNWYSQVNFQHNNNSIPFTPLSGVDVNCNWYGSLFPVYDATAVNEPGYPSQVPSQFGGIDPVINSDIRGIEAAFITYQPFLTDGTDNDLVAVGFQPVPGSCIAPPHKLYVNDNSQSGDVYTFAVGSDLTGTGTQAAPFATINHAVAAAMPGDTIYVDAGTYREDVTVNKDLKIFGSNYGIDPNVGPRVAEAIIQPATSDPVNNTYFYLDGANNTKIDGFTFDGNNDMTTSGVLVNGVDVDAAEAIGAYGGISNDTVSNNIIKNLNYSGIDFYNYYNGGAATTGNIINNNKFDNILPAAYGIGILIYNNCYTKITDNVMTGVRVGVQTGNFYQADPGTSHTISNNTVESARKGIWHNLAYSNATTFDISNNEITTYAGATNNDGIAISSIQGTVGVSVTGNNVTGARSGVNLWNCPTTNTVTVNGGTLTNCKLGVFPNNWDGYTSNASSSMYSMTGVTISNCDTAIYVRDNNLNSNGATVTLNVSDPTNTITGSGLGVVAEGGGAAINFTGTTPASFDGALSKYIRLATNGIDEPASAINAENVLFNSSTGSSMTQAQLFATEDKIDHKIDWGNLGFVSVKAGNDYVTLNSFYTGVTTVPAVQRGVDAASNGYIVNVDAGTFTEPSQLNIAKNVTVRGSGNTLTSINPSVNTTAGGNVPAEAFIFVDPAATVTLEKFAIDGAGKLIHHAIQSRGGLAVDSLVIRNIYYQQYLGRGIVLYSGTSSITNTTFDNIERIGVHVRGGVISPAPTVTINGITYTGKGMGDWLDYGVEIGGGGNATIQNSVITNNKGVALSDGSTSAGILATTYFGAGTTGMITNNYLTGNTDGIDVGYDGSDVSNITANYNDLSGNSSFAIKSTAPTVSANCNWYGMVAGGSIAAYVSGPVNYSPYLLSGTDAQPADIGFQTTSACDVYNNLYVNDSYSPVDDHYTTDAGSDVTGLGTPSAPFATIQHAIDVALPGDIIWVDAGLYEQNPVVNKSVTIYGSNKGIPGQATRTFAESVVRSDGAAQTAVFSASASNVRIDGFTIDGDDPDFAGVTLASGDDANTSYGIRVTASLNNLFVKNNIITKVAIGLRGDVASTGNLIDSNWFDGIGFYDFGYAVSLRTNFYADITNNKMTRVWTGVHTNNMNTAIGPVTWTMSGNEVHSYAAGLWYNLQYNGATGLTVDNNQFSAESGAVANNFGILMVSIQDAVNPSFTNNTITGTDYGIAMTNVPTTNNITLGSTNTITGTNLAAILLSNDMPSTLTNPIGGTVLGPSTGAATVKIDGININTAGGNGIQLDGFIGAPVYSLNVTNPTVLNNGVNGLVINGPNTAITGNSINNLSFVGQSGKYVRLNNTALAGLQIDATSSTFDGLTGATASLPQNFAIEDKINHRIDDATLGFIIVNNGNAYVTVNSFDSPNTTSPLVQRGVDAANAGWVVNVGPGTFTGQVEIAKDLTVLGQGAGVTTIVSPATLPLSFSTPTVNKPVIYGHDAATINVLSLTVDGAGLGNANYRFEGIGFYNAGGNIKYTEVKGIRNTPFDGVQGGNGIYAFVDNSIARTLNVISNNVYDFQKNGITMNGADLTATVDSNTITGQGATPITAQNGVQIGFGANGSVNNNVISEIAYTISGTEACGILTFNNPDPISITQNTITNCQTGIYVENSTSSIERNTITGCSYAGVESWADAGESTTFTAVNNFISGCDKGVYGFTDPAGTTSATINYNSITSSGTYAIENDGSAVPFNANCNWYGTTVAGNVATQVSAGVDYSPYLINGTDDEPATSGFQPVPGSCLGSPIMITETHVNTSCPSGNDGSIDITVTGGGTPYIYSWSNTAATEDISGLMPGVYTVTVTDIYGSVSSLMITVGADPDNTDPIITCPSDIIVDNDMGVCGAMVTVPVPVTSDNCGVATVINDFNNTGDASGNYPVGTTIVTWTMTDVNGNMNTCQHTVTVNDTEKPQFTSCPSIITNAPVNHTGCVASLATAQPLFTDNCMVTNLTWKLTGATTDMSPASGINYLPSPYMFNVGMTTVTYTASDAAGNEKTCIFTVSVVNTLAGSISGTATVAQNASTTSNITFTGSGGTMPYTFTYTINGGSPQMISTTGVNSIVTVPQSNAVTGAFVYTLVSVTDAYGCSGAIPASPNDQATITVVTAVPRPDLYTVVLYPGSSFFTGQQKDGYITLGNASPNPTTGTVTFRVYKMPTFDLDIQETTSSVTVDAGPPVAVDNNDWTITTDGLDLYYIITSKPGVVINGSSSVKIGFKLTAISGSNTSGIMTLSVINDTGGSAPNFGDSNDTNNQTVVLFLIN